MAMGKLAAEFALKHPQVQLEVRTEYRAVDMIEEGYDLVIRVNPDPDESLIGRAFLRDRLVVVANSRLPRPPAGTVVPVVVRGGGEQSSSWQMEMPQGSSQISVEPTLRLSSLLMIRNAVRLGVVAARLPISLVSHDLIAGTLV
ncbi:DNA-binding transcriptional regulator, LysR family (fragment) [Sinorhizobium medicae]|uniref:DNA-binding transcriptional regulator, LysR family n=1 Tax=Sinorhizobium medicae TaxID=110321 RepID=A0A508WWP4_9HYPH